MRALFLAIVILLPLSCTEKSKSNRQHLREYFTKVRNVKDSIQVGDMKIRNAFKHQILAHETDFFDSLRILKQVFKPNKYVFENCLGVIFGNENGKLFVEEGLYPWNKTILQDFDSLIGVKLAVLDSIDINKTFTNHLTAVQEITEQKGQAEWLLYFGPMNFQIFGGCNEKSMILDLFGDQWNTTDLDQLLAHEIEHTVFGPILENDTTVHKKGEITGLGITLDEGLASYFVYRYLDLTPERALYGEATSELMEREVEIFEVLEPFLDKTISEGCPIFRHCGRSDQCNPIIELSDEIDSELCYFLGFRIIELYNKNNGEGSWKDIYKIPLHEFYLKSGYKEYVKSKKM